MTTLSRIVAVGYSIVAPLPARYPVPLHFPSTSFHPLQLGTSGDRYGEANKQRRVLRRLAVAARLSRITDSAALSASLPGTSKKAKTDRQSNFKGLRKDRWSNPKFPAQRHDVLIGGVERVALSQPAVELGVASLGHRLSAHGGPVGRQQRQWWPDHDPGQPALDAERQGNRPRTRAGGPPASKRRSVTQTRDPDGAAPTG